jgi:pimeloyl-ACP methyl ester carboxylesterase
MELTVQGKPAYAYTGGKAFNPALPTVVFMHGAQHDHSVWILQSRYLAHHGYGVLAIDWPGHGRSAAPDGMLSLASVEAMADWVMALLDAAKVQQAILVGHSMGSLVALEAAARASTRVRGIALIATAAPMPVGPVLLDATRDDEALAQDMVNIWSHASPVAHKPSNPGPGFWVIGSNTRLMQRIAPGVMHRDFAACNAYQNGTAAAASVSCPAMVMVGKRDMMTVAKAGRAVAAAIKGATLVEADAGHALMAEAPDAVLDALLAFLARVRIDTEQQRRA